MLQPTQKSPFRDRNGYRDPGQNSDQRNYNHLHLVADNAWKMPAKCEEHHTGKCENFDHLVRRERAQHSRDRQARLARSHSDTYHVPRIREQHAVRSGAEDGESNDPSEFYLGVSAKKEPPANALEQRRREGDHTGGDHKWK